MDYINSLMGCGDSSGVAVMHPPRLRWPTPGGPFRVGEMCLEDVSLCTLSFMPMSFLPCMVEGMGVEESRARALQHTAAAAGWWVVNCTYEA